MSGAYQDPSTWSTVWEREQGAAAGVSLATVKDDPVYGLLTWLCPPREHETILEVGCGSGRITLALAKEFALRPTLLDFSSRALEFARRNAEVLDVAAEFVLANALDLSALADRFDLVWSGGVFEHFLGPDRQRVFAEAARACRSGGRAVVIVPNAWNLQSRLAQVVSTRLGRWRVGSEVPFAPQELRMRAAAAGLEVTKAGGVDWLASYWVSKIPGGRRLMSLPAIRAANSPSKRINRWFGQYIGVCGVRP